MATKKFNPSIADYNCEGCGRCLTEKEIVSNPDDAIICADCYYAEADNFYSSGISHCSNCGNTLEDYRCNVCGYVNVPSPTTNQEEI